jgi:hypothetical protein
MAQCNDGSCFRESRALILLAFELVGIEVAVDRILAGDCHLASGWVDAFSDELETVFDRQTTHRQNVREGYGG